MKWTNYPTCSGQWYFTRDLIDWDLARIVGVEKHEYGNDTQDYFLSWEKDRKLVFGEENRRPIMVTDGFWFGPLPNLERPEENNTEMLTIQVGTKEWDSLTRRRADLIVRKREALSPDEEATLRSLQKRQKGLSDLEIEEFKRLQLLSIGIIQSTFPNGLANLPEKLQACLTDPKDLELLNDVKKIFDL